MKRAITALATTLATGLVLCAVACSSSPAGSSSAQTDPSASASATGVPVSAASTARPAGTAGAASTARPVTATVRPAWQGQFTGYGTPAWQSAWGYLQPGSFGLTQLSAVSDASVPGGGQALAVLYGKGSSANTCKDCPSVGGGQFYTSFASMGQPSLAAAPVLYLRYYVKFPAGFDFGRGGKLPGLYGGPIGAESGGHHSSAGFSTRYMWRDHHVAGSVDKCSKLQPCAEVYMYSPVATHGYGADLGGRWQWQGDGSWHLVEQRVDRITGDITVWYDGTEVLNDPGALGGTAQVPFSGILFSTFFGGHDTSWGPDRDEYAYFADFAVSTSYIGPLLEGGRVARAAADDDGLVLRVVDHRGRLGAAVAGVDHGVDGVIELLGDLPPRSHRLLVPGQQQRARDQRLAELGEQRLGHHVPGDPYPDGLLPGMLEPARHFLGRGQDERVAARSRRLDGTEHRVRHDDELS